MNDLWLTSLGSVLFDLFCLNLTWNIIVKIILDKSKVTVVIRFYIRLCEMEIVFVN